MLHFLVMLGAIAGFFCRVTDQERSRDHASSERSQQNVELEPLGDPDQQHTQQRTIRTSVRSASASIRVAKVVIKTAQAASSTKGTSGS